MATRRPGGSDSAASPPTAYASVLQRSTTKSIHREICTDAKGLAGALAGALRSHAAAPPRPAPDLTQALQGNLTEFGTWDLGERHWFLYERHMTWTANADSPWKASSSDGIDVLALVSQTDLALFVMEVKSSNGHGANLITGSGSSLQSDFGRLFEGPVQERLIVSVGRVLTSLRLQHRRPDLEEPVKAMVGTTPAECASVKLVGVLLCNRGTAADEQTRERAFDRLATKLTAAGWTPEQLSFRTVEVESLATLLAQTVEGACR